MAQAPGKARQSAWMMSAGVLQGAVSFASNLVLVHFVEPEGFGRYALTFANVGIVLALLSLRLNVLVIRTPEDRYDAETRGFYFNAIVQECAVAWLCGLGWLALIGLLDGWGALLLSAFVLRHFANNAKAGYERGMPYRQLALLEGGAHLAAHLVAVGLVLAGAGATTLYLRELVLSVLLVGLLLRAGAVTRHRLRLLRPAEWWRLVRHARTVWLDGMLESVFTRLLIVLAGAVGGERGAGFFFQAYRLAGVPHQFLNPVAARLALNWFSREPDPHRRAAVGRRLVLSLALPIGGVALANLALADAVVPWLFGERWRPVVPVLLVLSGFILFATLYAVMKTYLIASHRSRVLLWTRIAQFTGLLLPLVPLLLGGPLEVAAVGRGVSLAYALACACGLLLLAAARRSGVAARAGA